MNAFRFKNIIEYRCVSVDVKSSSDSKLLENELNILKCKTSLNLFVYELRGDY